MIHLLIIVWRHIVKPRIWRNPFTELSEKFQFFPLQFFSNLRALQEFNFGIKLSQTEDELAGMQARTVLAEEKIFIEL